MITYAAFFVDETTHRNRRFWKSLLGDNYALADTLYAPRRADKAIRLRHCRTVSDDQKRCIFELSRGDAVVRIRVNGSRKFPLRLE